MDDRTPARRADAALLDRPPRFVEGQLLDEASFERLALAEPDRKWELHRGVLREKPAMSFPHVRLVNVLGQRLARQLNERRFLVLIESGRLRRPGGTFLMPDVCVVPTKLFLASERADPVGLGVIAGAVALIVEIWSPSTGAYDIEEKPRVYQERGDLEIWRLHPDDRTLTAWRRQPDGRYEEAISDGGGVAAALLPGVRIDLDALFAFK